MVRRMIKRKSYKRFPKSTFPLETGQSCVRYHRIVIQINWNAASDFGGEFDHATNLINDATYTQMGASWRKAEILKASMIFMPSNNLAMQTAGTTYCGPVFLAPYYGQYAGVNYTYSRLANIPGCIQQNPMEVGTKKRAYWYKKKDFEPFEITAIAGRGLDESYGGFLLFADGNGYTANTCAGHVTITYKVRYSDPKYLS